MYVKELYLEQRFNLAQVYLPLGYPEISGQEFANVIYQGTIVRLYQVPNDPRTDAQLWERRLFSDMSRMRATSGAWVRGALKASLGSRWSSVLLQIIKAKLNPWWDDAVEAWGSFGALNREAWRTAAKYQATFNDPGMIFFALQRTIYQAILFYSGLGWEGDLFDENESADALVWWEKEIPTSSAAFYLSGEYLPSWFLTHEPHVAQVLYDSRAAYGQYCSGLDAQWFYAKTRYLDIHQPHAPEWGSQSMYVDGKFIRYNNAYASSLAFGFNDRIDTGYRGLHAFKIGSVPFEYLDVS